MEKFQCEYCRKNFSTKSNLTSHKKRAKFCISQRSNSESVSVKISFECKYCCKKFTSNNMLGIHSERCNSKEIKLLELKHFNEIKVLEDKYSREILKKESIIRLLQEELLLKNSHKESEINLLKDLIESLQQKLENIAIEGVKKPSKIINTNNSINNVTNILTPFNLKREDILSIVENKLDETVFLNSQRGLAKFCVDNILRDPETGKMRMICTDPSRERFKYLDDSGSVKEDLQARDFIEKIYPPIHTVGEKLHESILKDCSKTREDIDRGVDTDTDKYSLKIREEASQNAWNDIRCIKVDSMNRDFRKELAILSNV